MVNLPLTKEEIVTKVKQVATDLGIQNLLSKYPSQLSGGESQRVAIGRVLVRETKLQLMDEPTSALDAFTKEKLQNLMIELQKKYNTTNLIVTHNIEEAIYLGHRIAVMENGRIKTVLTNPHAGEKGLREKQIFFDKQREIRRLLGVSE